jgi:hypothetical protein
VPASASRATPFASLIAGAFHTAGQAGRQLKSRYPQTADLEPIREKEATTLLKLIEEAIRAQDQRRSCALANVYGRQGYDARALFNLLLRYAVSEDGALHAEKYYRTVSEEFVSVLLAFRWQHLIALARHGQRLRPTGAGHGRGKETAWIRGKAPRVSRQSKIDGIHTGKSTVSFHYFPSGLLPARCGAGKRETSVAGETFSPRASSL